MDQQQGLKKLFTLGCQISRTRTEKRSLQEPTKNKYYSLHPHRAELFNNPTTFHYRTRRWRSSITSRGGKPTPKRPDRPPLPRQQRNARPCRRWRPTRGTAPTQPPAWFRPQQGFIPTRHIFTFSRSHRLDLSRYVEESHQS